MQMWNFSEIAIFHSVKKKIEEYQKEEYTKVKQSIT
jgi:hypothetical protein